MSIMKDVLEINQALGIDTTRRKADGSLEVLGSKEGQALRYNAGKLEWTRLPFDGLEDVVAMLMKSAKKYPDAPDGTPNFRKLWGDETPKITLNCAMRHLIAIMNGEDKDSDSGHYHSSHVIANMMFLNLYYNQKQKETTK